MQTARIIAGPCSVDFDNITEIMEIAKLPVWGVRVVGLKSVTSYSPDRFMGVDFPAYFSNRSLYPSIELAQRVIMETGKMIAFELMDVQQLYRYSDPVFDGKVFVWNPSTNQLGYPVMQTAKIASLNGWYMGIKNGKWVGDIEATIEGIGVNNMAKNWFGQVSYAEAGGQPKERVIMIHRGVDKPSKGEYRYPPDHESAASVKKLTGCQMFFDPSHCFGKKLRHLIVPETIKALQMLNPYGDGYLYDGALIEVGTSQTDTEQHISVNELRIVLAEVAKFRELAV